MTPPKPLLAALLAVGLAALATSSGAAGTQYAGASTVVAREGGQTVFDNGALVCSPEVEALTTLLFGQGTSAGGACLPFDGSGRVYVEDPLLSIPGEVAYQVCVDNDQDNLCSLAESTGWDPSCPDWIRFSHAGPPAGWANPMLGVPTALLTGGSCPGAQAGAWDGVLVFVCSGVHDTHEHRTTGGTVSTTGGAGGGPGFDAFATPSSAFCGPPPGVPAVKAYAVT